MQGVQKRHKVRVHALLFEEPRKIGQITLRDRIRLGRLSRIHRLGHVDDDRITAIVEDVVRREVAVDDVV